jgi:DNA uptake protein ComE-like DNA-binding protein
MNQRNKPTPKPEPNKVDEGVAETFPASDPPAQMGSTAVAGAPQENGAKRPRDSRVKEERISVDLNSASSEEMIVLPALSPNMVETLMRARPFSGWSDIERLPGFGSRAVEALQKGGARLGN